MSKPQPPPSRARLWLRLAFWAAVLASSALAARGVKRMMLDDPRFILREPLAGAEESEDFVIHGLRYASRARVEQVFVGDFGKNVWLVPADERRRRLLAVDWVEDATVARLWPNRLVVSVRERQPVAFVEVVRDAQTVRLARLALIDAEGVLLEQPPRAKFSFPILTGVFERQTEAERKPKVERLRRFLEEIGPLGKDVSEVDVSAHDLRVSVKVGSRSLDLLLGDRNYQKRMQRFLQHYPEIRRRSPSATLFDLRLDDRITAKE